MNCNLKLKTTQNIKTVSNISFSRTSHSHGLRQAERDRLPVRIVKLSHSLGVPVYLSQEHASAATHTHTQYKKDRERKGNLT